MPAVLKAVSNVLGAVGDVVGGVEILGDAGAPGLRGVVAVVGDGVGGAA